MVDRHLIAAVVDRLAFGAEATFEAGDARQLARLLPRETRAGFVGRFLGLGNDAGVSDVDLRDDKPRTVRLSTDERGVVRAGQWKLCWSGRHIEIDQIADVGPTARRSARLEFAPDGTPARMVQMVHRAFGPFVISAYRPWKEPC